MADDDAERLHASGAGSFDEFLLLQHQCLTANDAGHGHPLDGADGQKDQEDRAAKDDGDEDDEEDERDRIEHIDDAHHELVDATASKACNGAPGDADDQADERGDEADSERYLQAGDDAGDHVAAVNVSAQPMHVLERGADAQLILILGVELVRPDEGANDRNQGQQAEYDEAGHGGLVRQKTAQAVVPQGAALDGGLVEQFGVLAGGGGHDHSNRTFGSSMA